jgi:hypothetical protein
LAGVVYCQQADNPPLDYISEKVTEQAFVLENGSIQDAVRCLADQYDVHVGAVIRLVDGAISSGTKEDTLRDEKPNSRHTIRAYGARLAEAVALICKEFEGYQYEIDPDIVNIYPEGFTPFELPIHSLVTKQSVEELISKEYGISFAETTIKGEGTGALGSRTGWYWRRKPDGPMEFHEAHIEPKIIVRNRTGRELLNMSVRNVPYACWIAEAGCTGHLIDAYTGESRVGTAYTTVGWDYNTFDSSNDEQVLDSFLNGDKVFQDWTVDEEFVSRLDKLFDSYLKRLVGEKMTDRRWHGFWWMIGNEKVRALPQEKRDAIVQIALKWFDTQVTDSNKAFHLWSLDSLNTKLGQEFIEGWAKGKGEISDTARKILDKKKAAISTQ